MQARWTNTVIEFPLDRVRPASGEAAGANAEVLIFTGVRIERMYDLAERLPPARTGYVSNARMDIDFW
jgi:hypothetical protein